MGMTPQPSSAFRVEDRPRNVAYMRRDDRGSLTEIINHGTWQSVLTGDMHAGAVIGDHYHKLTDVYVHILTGQAVVHTVTVEDDARDSFVIEAGQGAMLPAMESHRVRFTQASTFVLLKSQPFDPKHPDTYPLPVDEV